MTAVELIEKRNELYGQIDVLDKEIREKRIEEFISEKGDILKDKWIRIGRWLFYSTGCVSPAKAFDIREFLEGNTDYSYIWLEFYGKRLMLHDDNGKFKVQFTNYDEATSEIQLSDSKGIVRIKLSKLELTYYPFQIIDKSDLETINKVANEMLFSDFDNMIYRLKDENDIWSVTINPNVKIELRNKENE